MEGKRPSIIGVFTGQGAQWARQGWELVSSSAAARRIIENLDSRLSKLPSSERPSWTLLEELQKEAPTSRINEAAFSQPLCTAIQILQVDMLQAANVEFTTVVGHSSGEIAAAYASGRISAGDAICIAYYRGLFSPLAQGQGSQPGAMIAVDTTLKDAEELCGSSDLKGRICVAANNSPSNITISGDKDAVQKVEAIFLDDNKRCIKVSSTGRSTWFSSVYGKEISEVGGSLDGPYWNQNLTQRVQFMEAIQAAYTSNGPFDMAIEIGPHPALKAPVLQTISEIFNSGLAYTGMLHRDGNAIECAAACLGDIWTRLGEDFVDLDSYDKMLSGKTESCRLVQGLPTYSWNHDNEYWHETRLAKAQRSRMDPVHPLLGHITADSTAQEIRWRHILNPKEIPWLRGHQLQGQIVFPAAAYVTLALEAALLVCKDDPITLIDVEDVKLSKALIFDNDHLGVEALFSLFDISRSDGVLTANFRYHAAAEGKHPHSLDVLVDGRVSVTLGEPSYKALPARGPRTSSLSRVCKEDFYAALEKLEYQYSSPFAALDELERKLGTATGFIAAPEPAEGLLLHPAILDAAFQSIFLTQAFPLDGGIWTLHVPKAIQSIRVNPSLCASETLETTLLPFDSVQPINLGSFSGDVDIYPSGVEHAMVQVNGISLRKTTERYFLRQFGA
ncbi:putative PKS/NRPS-like protein biosynthetic cluster [Diatrype stigma]|uniref:PKS/NRPS-like protein biosynthetic cluster n=1 Tax=Diatrype stigma TaxID=117547 RepID=A0AAN9UVG6_9PEZI